MRLFAVGAALIAAAGVSGVARADVKIVSEVNVTGVPPQMQMQMPGPKASFPQTVTEYRKAGHTRTEAGGVVYLHDCAGEKTYVLDPATKTYRAAAPGASAAAAASANPLMAMLQFNARGVSVKDGGETKTIAGREGKKSLVTATVDVGLMGGESTMPPLLSLSVAAESWNTTSVKMPESTCKEANASLTALPVPEMMIKGVKPVIDSLTGIPGTPLLRKVVLTISGSPQMGGALPKDPIVFTTTVQSVSEDALDDALFAVPADYKLVETPAPAPVVPGAPGGTPAAPGGTAAPGGVSAS